MYGRTDICFESFFVKKHSFQNNMLIEFTTQIEFDRVCVIAPKAPKIPKWLRIYHFFPLSIWIFSMLSHVLTYITWHLLQTFNPRRYNIVLKSKLTKLIIFPVLSSYAAKISPCNVTIRRLFPEWEGSISSRRSIGRFYSTAVVPRSYHTRMPKGYYCRAFSSATSP